MSWGDQKLMVEIFEVVSYLTTEGAPPLIAPPPNLPKNRLKEL